MRVHKSLAVTGVVLLICRICGTAARAEHVSAVDETVLQARSLASAGETARLGQVMARAGAGCPITVAVIGGSITQGAKATKPEKRYGNLIADWWRQKFPKAQVQSFNAGIGATGSNFGALRAQRDLLSKRPDCVVVEYACNDRNTPAAAESLEGLLRQILQQPNQPAVILLFMMARGGRNAQEWHSKIGRHYGLPMVSFRDALWPEIQAGRMQWEEVEADQVHPNDRGHAYCAKFVTGFLDQVLHALPSKDRLPTIKPLPQPALSDLFEHTALYEADGLEPVSNNGWSYDAKTKSWKSDRPGSVVEFEVRGRVVLAMHYVVRGPMGKARVSVDGQRSRELNAWFDETWGGYRQLNEVARLEDAGKHRVRFELLDAKSPTSMGHEFRILGIGTAGLLP